MPDNRSGRMGAALSLIVSITAAPAASSSAVDRAAFSDGVELVYPTEEISPALLKHWANNSVSILGTYKGFKETFQEKRRKRYDTATGTLVNRRNAFLVMMDFNGLAPILEMGNLASIRTTDGTMQASIQKTYMALHIGYLADEQEFGAYAILDDVGLYVSPEDAPGREYLFQGRVDDESVGFDAGYGIFAGFWRVGGLDLNLGTLVRMLPRTALDSAGREVFRFELVDSLYEGSSHNGELFLDVRYRQYSFNTLYTPGKRLEFLGFELDLEGGRFDFMPFFRYVRYRSRFQAGAAVGKGFGEFLHTRLELAGDRHEDAAGRHGTYYHAVLEARRILLRLPRSRLQEFKGHDFHIVLDHAASMSTDALDAFAAGMGGGISFEDMLGLFSIRIGGGYNEYGYISVFPIRNRFIADFKLQFAW